MVARSGRRTVRAPRLAQVSALTVAIAFMAGCVTGPTEGDNNASDDLADGPPVVPPTPDPVELGTVHIDAGQPLTYHEVYDVPGPELDVSGVNDRTLHTVTVDNSQTGYDIDLYFFDADGGQLSACETPGEDETDCLVPTGATVVRVNSYLGFDLDVTVWAT